MFGWIGGCMALSFKVIIGSAFWIIAIVIVCAVIGGVVYALNTLME